MVSPTKSRQPKREDISSDDEESELDEQEPVEFTVHLEDDLSEENDEDEEEEDEVEGLSEHSATMQDQLSSDSEQETDPKAKKAKKKQFEEAEGLIKMKRNIYEIDLLDMAWLNDELNPYRASKNLPPLTYVQLETALDHLERCDLLERTVRNVVCPAKEDISSETKCNICLIKDDDDFNQIILCEMCGCAVHQDCYGIYPLPGSLWFCDICEENGNHKRKCIFCPYQGGAMKKTICNRWAHILCCVWLGEIYFEDPDNLTGISGVERCLRDRKSLVCFICKKKQGACIQCEYQYCTLAYHATCAALSGLLLKVDEKEENKVERLTYCVKHTSNAYRHQNEISDDLSQLTIKVQAAYKAWHDKASKFEKDFARDTFPMVQEHSVKALEMYLDDPDAISLVEYWAAKRKHHYNLPQIKHPKNISLPKGLSKDSTLGEKKVALELVEKDIEMVDDLVLLTKLCHIRERTKKVISNVFLNDLENLCQSHAVIIGRLFEQISALDPQLILSIACRDKIPNAKVTFQTIKKNVHDNGYKNIEAMWKDYQICFKSINEHFKEGYVATVAGTMYMEALKLVEKFRNQEHSVKDVKNNVKEFKERHALFLEKFKDTDICMDTNEYLPIKTENVVEMEDLPNVPPHLEISRNSKLFEKLSFFDYRVHSQNINSPSTPKEQCNEEDTILPIPTLSSSFEHEDIVLDSSTNLICQVIDLKCRYQIENAAFVLTKARECKPQLKTTSGLIFVKTYEKMPQFRWTNQSDLQLYDVIAEPTDKSPKFMESLNLAQEEFYRKFR
uniref:PHD-type domain-containing protein n=1 Tax=Rhabditophanes sp. KR3021 TaxID=114890 RepID=A0AC35U924_9BILA